MIWKVYWLILKLDYGVKLMNVIHVILILEIMKIQVIIIGKVVN